MRALIFEVSIVYKRWPDTREFIKETIEWLNRCMSYDYNIV